MPTTRMVAKLKSMTAVTDLVSTRIYPMLAPQGVSLPYATYQRISRVPVEHSTGTTQTNFQRIQINCWAVDYDGAIALAEAVRGDEDEEDPTGLNGWNDSAGQVWHLHNETDDKEAVKAGRDEVEAHRVIQEYFV